MRRLAALIFDVDGTLADTEELHRQAFNAAFRTFGCDWSWSRDQYRDLLRVTGGKERIASYVRGLALPASEQERLQDLIPKLHACKTRLYADGLASGRVRGRPGVRRLMQEALRGGLRLAIASTTSPENIEPLLRAVFGSEAATWFSAIATGDVVSAKKPAPDIYYLALRMLAVTPACAVAFEDSAVGVRSAQAAGLYTVALPNTWTEGQDFAAAELVLESLGEPDRPVGSRDRAQLGAPYLTLRRLEELTYDSELSGGMHASGC